MGKNENYQLVTPVIPKGVNIIPNLKKMGLIYHDLQKFPELGMKNYMTTICETEDGTIQLVLMEWEKGLHKSGLLSLMHIQHFGCTT